MKMKKVIAAVTALALTLTACVSLSGCGEKKAKYTVGICQLVQHDALDAATKGFKDVLKEKLGDDIDFDEQNAANDSATCGTIVSQFVSNKVDLIMANATPALQAAAAATATACRTCHKLILLMYFIILSILFYNERYDP